MYVCLLQGHISLIKAKLSFANFCVPRQPKLRQHFLTPWPEMASGTMFLHISRGSRLLPKVSFTFPAEIPVIAGSPPEVVSLVGGSRVGVQLYEGNVYVDGFPVCDAGWDGQDATVACR